MAAPSLDDKTAKLVLRQVEFYFSDSNLPIDKFLKQTISESENGLVSLALICSFSKMRAHLKLGDVKADGVKEDIIKGVAEVLRKSSSLKLSEDGTKVGRSTQLLELDELVEQLDGRTVAASPLPHDISREAMETFFSQHGKVNSVRLPRHVAEKKLFCGTALIEFSTDEDAEKVLTQKLTYAGVELELRPKKTYDAEREKEVVEFEGYRSQLASNRKSNNDSEDNYPKGLIVAFTLKKVVDTTSAQNGSEEPTSANKPDETLDSSEKSVEESKPEENDNAKADMVQPEAKDCLEDKEKESDACAKSNADSVKDNDGSEEPRPNAASFVDDMNVVMREDLKKVFLKFGKVMFIDFSIGAESGFVRFEEPEGAQKARAAGVLAKEGGLKVKNFITTLEAVTGDAEKEYWGLLRGNQEKTRGKFFRDNGHGNRGRGGRHNKGGRFGRSRDNDSENGRPYKSRKY